MQRKIENRILTLISGSIPSNNDGDQLVYLVDGVECLRCNVGTTPVIPGFTPGLDPDDPGLPTFP